MKSLEAFGDLQREATEWRHYLHENAELDYRLHNTAKFVTEKLASSGALLPLARSTTGAYPEWDENRGSSPVPNAALPGQLPCPRSLRASPKSWAAMDLLSPARRGPYRPDRMLTSSNPTFRSIRQLMQVSSLGWLTLTVAASKS
ncbi:hypothetical protein CIT26_09935 [Mesorhizobium temperatum]|uniref:Uncharacterized protein n=2 Tax=Mesorhizobium temperatum TaxID=241416 RepID=A0A271LPE8_9HYPH|nr:hypothetical protein CIT26_09935 [Mesorhizobium temperatum]